jgi:hypothetical protein
MLSVHSGCFFLLLALASGKGTQKQRQSQGLRCDWFLWAVETSQRTTAPSHFTGLRPRLQPLRVESGSSKARAQLSLKANIFLLLPNGLSCTGQSKTT